MIISLFTILVGLVLIYFVWGAIDPDTVQDLESRLSRGSSLAQDVAGSVRTRNIFGVLITGTMFLAGLYYDLVREPTGGFAAPDSGYKPPTDGTAQARQFNDRIDAAVLQKEIERRKAVFQDQ